MKKISIIIPIYNSEKYIDRLITSILSQTYKDFEIILVDDSSSDSSLNICYKYLKNDMRIKIIKNTKNLGVSKTRNVGIKEASSDWIMFIDSDDEIENRMLEKMVARIDKTTDFVFCGLKKYNNANECIANYYEDDEIMDYKQLFKNIGKYLDKCLLQGPCGKLYKKSIINQHNLKFKEDLSYGEDTLFVYNYLKLVNKIVCIKDSFYHYNLSNNESLNLKFRNDKIDINLFLNKELYELIKDYNSNSRDIYFNRNKIAYINYCDELTNSRISNKHSIIKRINSLDEIKNSFNQNKNTLQEYFLKHCILHGFIKVEIIFFIGKSIIKKFKK